MIKILISGDYYLTKRVKQRLECGGQDVISKDIVEAIRDADLAIVNYESPMTEGVNCAPIEKSGPVLSSDKRAVDYIKTVGFGLATLANNHTSDYGTEGLLNTIAVLNKAGIATVGAGKNLEDAGRTYYLGDEVAIINCCEHEFGIAKDDKAGANPLNAVRQYYQISNAREHAKHVIVITHGGCERFQYPTPRMKQLYRFFIDAGADAVVNAHQHCFSGYERYYGKPIFYGLGNFCFDEFSPQDKPSQWNYGYMVVLTFSNGNIEFDLLPYCQSAEQPIVKLLEAKEKANFQKEIANLNSVIADDAKLASTYKQWIAGNDGVYRYLMRPFDTKKSFLVWLKSVITMYLNKSLRQVVLNCIRCESHRERLLYLLEDDIVNVNENK